MQNSQLVARLTRLQASLVVLYALSLPISLTASWVILCAALVVWIVQKVLGERGLRAVAGAFTGPPLALPMAAFAAAVFISGLANGGILEGLRSLFSLKALIVYFWAYNLFETDRPVMLVALPVLLSVGAAAGVFGAIEQIFNFHPFGYKYLQGTGFLGGPMAYAGQMQILSMLAIGLFLKAGYKQFRFGLSHTYAFALIVLANVLGLIFASERSAWLGALAGALALSAVVSWRSLIKCILLLAVLCALLWFTVPVVRTRVAPLANWQQDVSVSARLKIWHESARLWRSSPIVGIGMLHFPHFDMPEAIVPGRSKDLNHAHSNYLQILSTTGLVGLVTYLWIWMVVLSTALRCYRRNLSQSEDGLASSLALGVLGATAALMVSGIFEYNFGTAQVRLAQWFVLAMLRGNKEA